MAQPAVPDEPFALFSNEVGQHTAPALRLVEESDEETPERRAFRRAFVATLVAVTTAVASAIVVIESASAPGPW